MSYERYESEDEDGGVLRMSDAEVKLATYGAETERMAVLLEIARSGIHGGLGNAGAAVRAEKRLCEMLDRSQIYG